MSNRGGKRAGAGRKPRQQEDEILSLFANACPPEQRATIIRSVTARAQAGDVRCADFIFNRIYGTPLSGDDLKLREKLEAELADLFKTMETGLSPQAWQEVSALLGLEANR